jgi:hypothetical protein
LIAREMRAGCGWAAADEDGIGLRVDEEVE